MKWLEAIAQVADKASLTNREAAGLIQFARLVYNKYVKKKDVALTPYDWYRFAVVALGWFKRGDKFKVSTQQQLLPYPKEAEAPLKLSLATMARELDEAGVPFEMLTDPRGTDTSFRQLAKDAWAAMKALDAQPKEATDATIQPVGERIEIKPPKGKPTDTNTAVELEVPATIEPKKTTETEPTPSPMPEKKSGSGVGLLLLFFALGSSKKRSRGRR